MKVLYRKESWKVKVNREPCRVSRFDGELRQLDSRPTTDVEVHLSDPGLLYYSGGNMTDEGGISQ